MPACRRSIDAAAGSEEAGEPAAVSTRRQTCPASAASRTNPEISVARERTRYRTGGAAGRSTLETSGPPAYFSSIERNSSRVKISLARVLSGSETVNASRSTWIGASVRIRASSRDSRALSAYCSSAARWTFLGISPARAMSFSSEPNCRTSSFAPFSPIPGTPGMLSVVSPINANTSGTCSGRTPNSFSTISASMTRLSLCGLRIRTPSPTSWNRSLSAVTIMTGRFISEA